MGVDQVKGCCTSRFFRILKRRYNLHRLTNKFNYYTKVLSLLQAWYSRPFYWRIIWCCRRPRFVVFAVCLCVWVFCPTREFFTHWRHYRYLWKALSFYSVLMTIGQWGFFSVPHLLWHRISVYNGHLWKPKTLLPNDWQWSCHYLFERLRSIAAGIETSNLPLARRML